MDSPALAAQLEARTRELVQAADQLAATSEVLRAISNSRSDPGPVLKAVAEHAARLCDADISQIFQIDGELLRVVASHGPIPSRLRGEALRITRGSVTGRAVIDRRTIHIHDLSAELDTEFPDAKPHAGLWGHRTTIATPLLREDAPIGAIFIRRTEVRPFTDRQIALLETFAHQAGIAIEQVRMVRELEVRNQEVTESLEQQTATAEILKVISSSPTDVQPVLDAVAENATRVCDAGDAAVLLIDGGAFRLAAHYGTITAVPRDEAIPINRGTVAGRAILERAPVHVPDLLAAGDDFPEGRVLGARFGHRTTLATPLLREGTPIGALLIRRTDVRPFTDKQIALLQTFASQAVIAIENVRLFNETKEALEQQTATAEILSVISSSPTDVQPVFKAVVKEVVRLCEADNSSILRREGEVMRYVTHAGNFPDERNFMDFWESVKLQAGRGTLTGRVLLERRSVQIDDIETDPDYERSGAQQHRGRTHVAVPLLKDGEPIGLIIARRFAVRPFTDKQIGLLEIFASQAVIAIENVRLFKELEARNRDLNESLNQQTATAEVLKVISRSTFDLDPVLVTLIENATMLCHAEQGFIFRFDGEFSRLVASHNTTPEFRAFIDNHPIPPGRGTLVGRVVLERSAVHIPDAVADPEYEWRDSQALGRFRTMLGIPMLRQGVPIGVIALWRGVVQPFSQKEIELVTTFADQAVIAIENVRLFKELQARNAEITEALEQQTATAEILRVISSSPTEIQPVLDAVVATAARLCGASDVIIRRVDGDVLRIAAHFGPVPVVQEALTINRGTFGGRAVLERRTIHVEDLAATSEYSISQEVQRRSGARTVLAVPLMREDMAIGTIAMRRSEVRPFSAQQIKLLETFAAQAVIAIENVRLFNETKEALERQTATSGILEVMSGSPTDVQPVFDAIVKSGARLFSGAGVAIALPVAGQVRIASIADEDPERCERWKASYPFPLTRDYMHATAMLDRRMIDVPDALDPPAEWSAGIKNFVRTGYRALTITPMMRGNTVFGTVSVVRVAPGPLTDKQVEILKTFADQAVIAIENVRLFNETKEALEQQTATADILRVISSSPTDTQPVFDAIVKSGVHLFGGMNVSLRLVKGDHTETVASTIPLLDTDRLPQPLDENQNISSRSVLRREVIQIPDIFSEVGVNEITKQRAQRRGFRAIVSAPMLRENVALGAINVMRAMPGPFTDKQIALLKTFADQAVIAIENVRLFKELQARNAEIMESLEQQTATAEILSVISSSPTDLQPVFDAILQNATRLCDAHLGTLGLYEGEKYQHVAQRGGNPAYVNHIFRGPFPLESAPTIGRMVAERRAIHVPNLGESPQYRAGNPAAVATFELGGARTVLAVPMLKEERVVGGIFIYRPEVRPFTQKQIDLVSTFANQAVIAIENVRLFNETKEALERQTSIAEILRVISSSPTDVMPVLEAVTHRAAQLCDAPDARLFLVDGDTLRYVTGFGELKGVVEPLALTRGIVMGRAIIDQSVVHIEDVAAAFDEFPEAREPQRLFGHRTTLAVPLVRENKAFGAILMRRKEVRPFTEKQIELVTTFADQAVIAIENVRLFNEIQDKSRQLEVASRHKSQFLANMSHELRTPLNAILGYTELILDGIYGDVSGKVHDVMGRVEKSGRHLLGLINDVLDLSKIEAGQLTLALADYSLADVVQTVFTSVGSLATEKKLALKVALASDLPRGRGDDRRLTQVLLNLVGNAIKFTEAGEVRLEARCSDGAFVVSVADTGPGISEADQQRIFEEFQQVDDSATRKKGGTGLGLSIARRIIELHGGRIQVESAPGRGSTFTVTLPVRVEHQASSL